MQSSRNVGGISPLKRLMTGGSANWWEALYTWFIYVYLFNPKSTIELGPLGKSKYTIFVNVGGN